MRGFLPLLTCFAILQNVRGWREFSRGRWNGGNLRLLEGDDSIIGDFENVITDWFTQYLDHSNPTDDRTWKQRYYVNDQYVSKRRDVAFLMIGGEGEASDGWMVQGAWINYAEKFNAICFQLEHRYYGESHPTADMSTENLQYLTSEQALADIAYFIQEMNVKYELSPNVKWIAFGGSYAGSLAAWVRQKYPHLVYGSMSASAPVLAKINFSEYHTVVYEDLKDTGGDKCVSAVKQAFNQVDLMTRDIAGQRKLYKLFHLCDNITESTSSSEDIVILFDTLRGHFAGIAQFNKKNGGPHNINLDTLCNIMVNDTLGPEVNRLAAVNYLMTAHRCLDCKYDTMISEMRDVSWDSEAPVGGRQWYYQTCTDFGFYQTTDRIPLDFFIKQCSDIFGPKFNLTIVERGVQRTNTLYGGLNPSVTNVIFVQGSYDPWHALGINKSTKLYPAVVIDSASHCENMYSPSVYDSEALRQARIQIEEFIGNLLKSA
ncbi:unnamed protein product [Callosobruchus maculatus]|uniref:Serine protease K12H4.7 n=1 Tax=Callosobruchus maculatus TaxID=64391 RepID=A0A653BXD8_CALMS|nr:unnamed protein product [Callosobruchus maculatus]